jgi:hypothetical protein
VSCSFNPRSGLCYTCLGEPHRAWESDGAPVAVVLSNQPFPANVPAADGGECLRVMRVEDGSELLQVLKRNMVVPGMVIMPGSLSKLGKYGTAWYTAEWIKNRNLLKRELGDVLVVPLLPLVSVSGVGSHVVRSLLEFFNWVDDLQDPEMELLMPVEGGQPWASERQNLMFPISLYGEGVMLYSTRIESGAHSLGSCGL